MTCYFGSFFDTLQQLLIVHCQLSILVQKTPFIPHSGRKANLPRYHPHLPFFTAHFSDADTPQTDNGVTRPALLIFQAAAPGRKPVCCTHGASTVPRSLKCKPTKGSPIAAFDCYGGIIPPRFRFCKYFFGPQWVEGAGAGRVLFLRSGGPSISPKNHV